jgi:hypothetical protein
VSQEYNLTVWKLQRITMCVPRIFLDLPEDSRGVVDSLSSPVEEMAGVASYFPCKSEFCPRKYTHCHVGIFRRGESCSATVELVSYQFVADLGGS